MKTYTVNYVNLKTGNSSTFIVEAENIKAAKQLAQRHKKDRQSLTFTRLYYIR